MDELREELVAIKGRLSKILDDLEQGLIPAIHEVPNSWHPFRLSLRGAIWEVDRAIEALQ